MNNNNEIFENAPVGKAVARMAVPTIISMLVVVIYNMADTFFIGQTGDAMQVAAVSISAPVFTILMAFGNLFGIGGSSAIARALGAKNWNVQTDISFLLLCINWNRRIYNDILFAWNEQNSWYDWCIREYCGFCQGIRDNYCYEWSFYNL